jgi:protein SCO1
MKKWLSIMTFVLIFLTACSDKTIENEKNWPVEPFEYTDHNGEPFSSEQLKGKIWIADFIFTNCVSVCPPMTMNMKKLRDKVNEEGIEDIHYVSFSVDPENDTPQVLKEYALKFTDDLTNWHFITGYVQEHIEQFAKDSFKSHVQKPVSTDQVIHASDFFLVDQNGVIRKYYSGLNDIPFDEIINDIKILKDRE